MRFRPFILPSLLLAGIAGVAGADSQFASNGVGVGLSPTHVRGWTMGGLGVALDDTLRLSLANPAAPGGFREVSLNILYLADRRAAKDDTGEEFFTSSGFPLFEFLIPFGSRFAAGFGYVLDQDMGTARTRIPFDPGEEAGVPHVRFFERRGALFRVPGVLAFRFFRDLRFGVRLDNYFFNVEEDYDLVFDDRSVYTTRERLLLSGAGTGGTVGLMVPLLPGLHAGVVYTTEATLKGDRKREGASGSVSSDDVEVGVPARAGAGISYRHDRWSLGAEIRTAAWGDVSDTLAALGGYADVTSWSVGVERMPERGDPWFLALPLRAGYRVEPLPLLTEEGGEIDRWSLSFGSGFPIGVRRSFCDFGVEYGRIGSKGDLGLEEEYYRILIGFTGQEPWRKRQSYVE